jgi:hypothetical protein
MPKKLTKTQIKRTLIKMNKDLGRMLTDRMQYPTMHNVPLTVPKIVELSKALDSAIRRIK